MPSSGTLGFGVFCLARFRFVGWVLLGVWLFGILGGFWFAGVFGVRVVFGLRFPFRV